MTDNIQAHRFKPNGFGSDHCLECGGKTKDHRRDKQMTDNTPLNAGDEPPRAVQNGMSMEELETWMFLAGRTGLDEPYTYAVKQSDLTEFLRDYRKRHELEVEKEILKRVLPYLKRPGMYDLDLVAKEYIGRLRLVEQELERL